MSVAASLSPAARKTLAIAVLSKTQRNYFFRRRQLAPQSLDWLRFFLNHRTCMRSERPERVGKSPTQLITGPPHAHWLELLGFQRFQRA